MSKLEEAAQIISALEEYKRTHQLEYYKPYDYQKRFHNARGHDTDKPAKQRALMAANQCITPWTVLQTDRGERQACEMLGAGSIYVRSWDGSSRCTRKASALFLKGIEPAFRVHMDNGDTFDCSCNHRVLTIFGWLSFDRLIQRANALHWYRIDEDSTDGYVSDVRQHDGQPPGALATASTGPPSVDGALVPVPDCWNVDATAHRSSHNRAYPAFSRWTIFDDDPDQLAVLFGNFAGRDALPSAQCRTLTSINAGLFPYASTRSRSILQGLTDQSVVLVPWGHPELVGGNRIVAVAPLGYQPIVDIDVSGTHCYQTAGVIHHNTGKTTCGAHEVAMHVTGMYPKWWEGTRFTYPNEWLVASTTNETTRDRCQKDLFGEPMDDKAFGTGVIPLDVIGERMRKPGVPNAYDSVMIKHKNGGWSKIVFRAYEQGPKKFMGSRLTGGYWADEEPPAEINSQLIRGIFATQGIGLLTFTPEEGMTEVVAGFMNDIQIGQALIRATWDDCPHMTPERRELALAGIPAHERDMRAKGEPLMGSGRVFDVPEDVIMCDPFEIPPHYPRINGLDFGWAHPCATAFIAIDRDKDCVYVYDGYRASRVLIPVHAVATKAHGDWIPCAWPHDGLQHDKQSGKIIADLYRDSGTNMWPEPFTNPPAQGMEEGKGGIGIEAGVHSMLEMMQTGRFKVFSNVKPWWEEMRMYHRKDGKVVASIDDFISATRIAVMFRRHATTKIVRQPKFQVIQGIRNWS